MQRRTFLKNATAAGAISMLDPAYLMGKEKLATGSAPQETLERRPYGRSDDRLSIIGFGGIILSGTTQQDANDYVAEAVRRGVNYFDVAPSYGNAQERLGPALRPYRDKCFLACKTLKRDVQGAREELEDSLKKLGTDHVDLYQFHALTKLEDVDQIFATGGAMETFQRAKRDGKVRNIGFSAHSEEAALAALDRFAFDSALFPLSISTWIKGEFGHKLHKRVKESGRGILAIKAMAHQTWTPQSDPAKRRRWKKTWYEPFDDTDTAALGLRFTLHLPVTAMLTPGDWRLFKLALDLAQAGALVPLNEKERRLAEEIARTSAPIFPRHA